MKTVYFFFLMVVLKPVLKSQDLHFSQFNENPSLVNPALTGATNPFKAILTFKDQWNSVTNAYKTYGLTVEKRFTFKEKKNNNQSGHYMISGGSSGRLGTGLAVYNDKAGDGGLGQTRVNLSVAGFVPINKRTYFSVGIQGSFVQRTLDQTKLVFPSQFNGTVYDPSLSQGENFGEQRYNYGDFAVGALWSHAQDQTRIALNNFFKANIGFALYHVNRPEYRFVNSNQKSPMKLVAHADFLMCQANSDIAWAPSYMLQFQGKSMEFVVGCVIKKYLKDKSKYTGLVKRSSVNYGLYYRNKDAVVLSFMYEKEEEYAIGISYDINFSGLASASRGRGGLELALRYTPAKDFLFQKKAKPDSMY